MSLSDGNFSISDPIRDHSIDLWTTAILKSAQTDLANQHT